MALTKAITKAKPKKDIDMDRLPLELVRHIRDYVYRFDWKTCKKKEANEIWTFCMCTEYDIQEREQYYKDVQKWSLYGQMWLSNASEYELFASRRPLIEPPPYSETQYQSVQEYYRNRIQWLNG